MAYTAINFKTKKALKDHVGYYLAAKNGQSVNHNCEPVRCYQPGLGPDLSNYTGTVSLEGPHAPSRHSWYASAELVNGIVVKVK